MSSESECKKIYGEGTAYGGKEFGPLNLSRSLTIVVDNHEEQPDVKQTLKCMIRARRLAEGKADLNVDLSQEKPRSQLTPEELMKQKDRKEQNRKAAIRCREKKRKWQMIADKELRQLRVINKELKTKYQELVREKEKLINNAKQASGPLYDQFVPNDSPKMEGHTAESYTCMTESSNSGLSNIDSNSDSDEDYLTMDLSSSDETSRDSQSLDLQNSRGRESENSLSWQTSGRAANEMITLCNENEALDLSVRRTANNLPVTIEIEDSDDENQPASSQNSSCYDSGYPSSSLESDIHSSQDA